MWERAKESEMQRARTKRSRVESGRDEKILRR
jgi:hypothetical protein